MEKISYDDVTGVQNKRLSPKLTGLISNLLIYLEQTEKQIDESVER